MGVEGTEPKTDDRQAVAVGQRLSDRVERKRNGPLLRVMTLLTVAVPFVAFFVAVDLLWNKAVTWLDLALMVFMHVIATMGVTVGFHRLLTHRSFQTYPAVRGTLAALGSLAIEGRPTHWVADHRKHHAYADEEGDPHSPHAGRDPGIFGAVKAALHAHVGWLFKETNTPLERFVPDLLRDRTVMAVDRQFGMFAVLAFAIPFALGFLLSGFGLMAGLSALFWAGLVRVGMTHHITWSVNSICHMFGRRPFDIGDRSTNNWVLALPTMGEAWHHNHHAFPTSAFHGLKRWQFALDPSGWVIWVLEKLHLAWDVKRVSGDQMAAKAS